MVETPWKFESSRPHQFSRPADQPAGLCFSGCPSMRPPGTRGVSMADDRIVEDSLEYHRRSPAGKLAVVPTKPLVNQRDLALAYSPGVAAACNAIAENATTGRAVETIGWQLRVRVIERVKRT